MKSPSPSTIQAIMALVNTSKDEQALKMIGNNFEVGPVESSKILSDMKTYAQNIEIGFIECTLEEIGEPLFADPSSIYSPLSEFFLQYYQRIIPVQRLNKSIVEAGQPWRLETEHIKKVYRTIRINTEGHK